MIHLLRSPFPPALFFFSAVHVYTLLYISPYTSRLTIARTVIVRVCEEVQVCRWLISWRSQLWMIRWMLIRLQATFCFYPPVACTHLCTCARTHSPSPFNSFSSSPIAPSPSHVWAHHSDSQHECKVCSCSSIKIKHQTPHIAHTSPAVGLCRALFVFTGQFHYDCGLSVNTLFHTILIIFHVEFKVTLLPIAFLSRLSDS